jgi:hypothetical protein
MPGTVYQWRSGARIPVEAQAAGEEIEHLRKKANGALTPAFVVDAARDVRHTLHPAFEWNDSEAAERYREEQARHLIGALVVTVKPAGVTRQVRAFVSVHQNEQQGYTSLPVAMSDAELRQQVIERALRELEQWRERYQGYVELADVFAAIETAAQACGKGRGASPLADR